MGRHLASKQTWLHVAPIFEGSTYKVEKLPDEVATDIEEQIVIKVKEHDSPDLDFNDGDGQHDEQHRCMQSIKNKDASLLSACAAG